LNMSMHENESLDGVNPKETSAPPSEIQKGGEESSGAPEGVRESVPGRWAKERQSRARQLDSSRARLAPPFACLRRLYTEGERWDGLAVRDWARGGPF